MRTDAYGVRKGRTVRVLLGIVAVVSVVTLGAAAPGAAETGVVVTADNDTAPATADTGDLAELRFFHASPDTPPVDVYIDGEPVAENASFAYISAYNRVSTGVTNVTIRDADDPNTVRFQRDLALSSTAYTFALAGESGPDASESLSLVVFNDTYYQPGENESLVRVAHLSPDLGTVDVTATNETTAQFGNLSFADVTAYERVPDGIYEVTLTRADGTSDGPLHDTSARLDEDRAYTWYAVGSLDEPDTDRQFRVIRTIGVGTDRPDDESSKCGK